MPKRPQNSSDVSRNHEIPRWRRIEILREKAELREALGDIDFEIDANDVEEEVFGSDEEYISFHEHTEIPEEDLADIDEDADPDDDPDDDFEVLEDDWTRRSGRILKTTLNSFLFLLVSAGI